MFTLRRKSFFFGLLAALAGLAFASTYTASAGAATYYVSPDGDDANNGTTAGAAWQTFGRAWEGLAPGDTLLLLDGRYTEATTGVIQPNIRNGEPGRPITVKALNDGAATVDGQGQVIPLKLGDNWGPDGAKGDWYVVEGLVVRNGTDAVVRVQGNHNVLRRLSVYDGDADDNSLNVVLIGDENLVEDVVVAGSGRYMIDIFAGTGNTVRRAFTLWQRWDGRRFCGVTWPNGNHIGIYNASHNTVENAIAYGRALTGIFIQANSENAVANDNQVLGSMALLMGRDYDGSRWQYFAGVDQPSSRPGPTSSPYAASGCDDYITQWDSGNQRTGFSLWGQGELHDNVYRDVLAVGNMSTGLSIAHPSGPASVRTIVDHATLQDNGGELAEWEKKFGGNIFIDRGDVTVSNSRIANSQWADQGEGARFGYRYVDRRLTDQPLWPWPMEDRIMRELGMSVTEIAAKYANVDGYTLAVSPTVLEIDRNGTVEVNVKVDAFGKFAKPVALHVAANGNGLRLDPADGTVNAPGQWTFRVTAPDEAGVHQLQITAKAEGESELQRTVIILVDPKKVFLPAIRAGK